jgi:hypothetical protein
MADLYRRRQKKIEQLLGNCLQEWRLVLLVLATFLFPQASFAQSTEQIEPAPLQAPQVLVQPKDRQASLLFYRTHYLLPGTVDPIWNGDVKRCDPGYTDPAFREAVLKRINYYRGMAGLAPAAFDEVYNRKAQQAALITTINGLNHKPPASAHCYTAEGAQAAANSHLYIGRYGPAAIDGYIQDHDEGVHDNYHVGHRRWVLLPQLQVFGTGDIIGNEEVFSANALWVVDDSMREPRPQTRDGFVAWPPPGYVPYNVVYPRWSFSYPGADFSQAVVHMARAGDTVEVAVEPLYEWKPTEATLVWIPLSLGSRDAWPRPQQDTTYTVTITNINVDGRWLSFSYEVTVFDPMAPMVGATPTPLPTPAPRLLHYRQSLRQ